MNTKEKELLAMYASVERMNQAVLDGNPERFLAERHLQINLRTKFETLD